MTTNTLEYMRTWRDQHPTYSIQWDKAHRKQKTAYLHFYRILHADQRTVENLVAEITGRKTH